MAQPQRMRHTRHRRFRGLGRGGARTYNPKLNAWLEERVATLAPSEAASAVTAANATNIFTDAGHGLYLGQVMQLGGTAPAGLAGATDYYAIPVSANTFQLANSEGGARRGEALAFTDDGTAVTYTRQATKLALLSLLGSVSPEQLQNATDINAV